MIVAVSTWRNEEDVAAGVVRHLLEQGVDKIVISDNLSTDQTRRILDGLPVLVEDDPDPAFYQGAKVTALMHRHCSDGDWVVPFDADELWMGEVGTLAEAFAQASASVLAGTVYDYLPQPEDDPDEPDPFRRIRWREPHPEPLSVVAFRYRSDAVVHDGNHGVDHPGARAGGLRVAHFQYRTFEQFRRKLRTGKASLEATALPAWIGTHWRTWGALDDEALRVEWDALLTQKDLVLDPCR